jgi:hypothetical protein
MEELSASTGMREKVEESTTFSTFGLLFYPEDVGTTFLRNVRKHLPSHRALHHFIAIAARTYNLTRLRRLRQLCRVYQHLWNIRQRSPLKASRCFGGTCRLPSSRSKNKPSKKLLLVRFLFGLFFDPENRDHMFYRNVG